MKAEIPGNSGYSYQYQNFGQTSNKGIEMSMDAVLVDTKNFSLNFTANVAYNRNRIDKLTTDSLGRVAIGQEALFPNMKISVWKRVDVWVKYGDSVPMDIIQYMILLPIRPENWYGAINNGC